MLPLYGAGIESTEGAKTLATVTQMSHYSNHQNERKVPVKTGLMSRSATSENNDSNGVTSSMQVKLF